jgi:diacylglycerol kinase family enzyme
MTWEGVIGIAALVVAAGALVLALLTRRALVAQGITVRSSQAAIDRSVMAGTAGTRTTDAAHTQVAFIANPTKPGVPELRDAAVRACAARYLPEPMWLDTTEGDPGIGQAREAVRRGAQVVIAVGGDGTVRAVAEGLAGTQAAMGLIPQGTGNLLARNLGLPINDVDDLLRIALTGRDRPIDVGWLTVVRDESMVDDDISGTDPRTVVPEKTPRGAKEPAREHIFLVIAGLGFDAAMVADTDEELKAKVGWVAYIAAGIKHSHARRMRLELSFDGSPWRRAKLRSVLIGNIGKLPGGITLLPDAEPDDGWLDIGTIDTRGGALGWAQLFGEVAMQRFGVTNDLPNKVGRIDHIRVRRIGVRSRDPQQVQVDGDTIGSALEVSARLEERSLMVRVPV